MKPLTTIFASTLGMSLLYSGITVANDSLSTPDISQRGKAVYACALAENIRATHQQVDDFGLMGEDAAFDEAIAIGPLIGVFESQAPFSDDLGRDIMKDFQTANFAKLLDDLDRMLVDCNEIDAAS